MNIWHDIDPARITPRDFIAYIEITKGQKQKYELDKATGMLILDRVLYTATRWTCWCCAPSPSSTARSCVAIP